MIQDALVNIRFNDGRGYFFIYSMDYECILLPVARRLEGTNFYKFQDGKGMYLTREIIRQLQKEDEAFLSWWYHKPSDMKNQYRKIGFNKYFEPLDWFIGTGEYFVDFEESVKQEVLSYVNNLSFQKNKYYFIFDYNMVTLSHIKHNFVDKKPNVINNLENMDKVFTKMIDLAKKEGGYVSYIQKNKPGTNLVSKKTSYVNGINSWEWVIGRGFYEDDIKSLILEKEEELNTIFKKYLINIFLVSFILVGTLLVISISISKILERKFVKYKKDIQNHLDENTRQHHIVSQQSKMAAMGEMLGNIAHQWRQPLSVITTASTTIKLKKELKNLDDEFLDEAVDAITNSAQYLSMTIDDFRNFFKSNKKKELFNIEDVFEKLFKLIDAQFKTNNIVFVTDIKNFELYGLERELIQALINILNNAKDVLDNKDEPRVIFINTYVTDKSYVIKIKDIGGGIDEDITDKIFEPYFTTKHQSKGTGIGLYMCQEIIHKHMQGKITINNAISSYENQEYLGAEFTIEFQKRKESKE